MHIVLLIFVIPIVMIILAILGVISLVKYILAGREKRKEPAKYLDLDFLSKASTDPIPENPQYYNIGSTTMHSSKECCCFSTSRSWDAITEYNACSREMSKCHECTNMIVFIYPRGKVYHQMEFCSNSSAIPLMVTKNNALAKGLHKCNKCW